MIKVKNSVDYIQVFFTQITASISSDTLKHIIGVSGKQSTPAPETVTVRKNNFALKTRKVSLFLQSSTSSAAHKQSLTISRPIVASQ